MIPKIIHYCWFGNNPLPPIAIKCIDSWKKYCEGFDIKEWNGNNFDVEFNKYSKEAAEQNKWAFVSDVARLSIVCDHGGIYLDVDVELIKPIDHFLIDSMFIGFEKPDLINTGQGFGAQKHFYLVKKMLDAYNDVSFINFDGTLNTAPCPVYNTKAIEQEGFAINNTKQFMNGITIYPMEYFCPKDWKTGNINITNNTYAIHHFVASWWSEEERKQFEFYKKFEEGKKRFYIANQNNLK
jgi:mannosyltransferase OCH1-like enzyme